MTKAQEERDRLQKALKAFYTENEKRGLKSRNRWATTSGVSTSAINPVLNGKANKRLEDETYFKLADGATKLLNRQVTVDELKGTATYADNTNPRVALRNRFNVTLDKLTQDELEAEIRALEARYSDAHPSEPQVD